MYVRVPGLGQLAEVLIGRTLSPGCGLRVDAGSGREEAVGLVGVEAREVFPFHPFGFGARRERLERDVRVLDVLGLASEQLLQAALEGPAADDERERHGDDAGHGDDHHVDELLRAAGAGCLVCREDDTLLLLGDEALDADACNVLGLGHQALDGDTVLAGFHVDAPHVPLAEDGVEHAEGRGVGGHGRAPVERDGVVGVTNHLDRAHNPPFRALLQGRGVGRQVAQHLLGDLHGRAIHARGACRLALGCSVRDAVALDLNRAAARAQGLDDGHRSRGSGRGHVAGDQFLLVGGAADPTALLAPVLP